MTSLQIIGSSVLTTPNNLTISLSTSWGPWEAIICDKNGSWNGLYQSWKVGAGWPFHFEQMHSFPLRCFAVSSWTRHNRKSSRIVLLNQWLHCASLCSLQEQFYTWSIILCALRHQCPTNSEEFQLPWLRAHQGQQVLNSVSCQSKETALWFSVHKKKKKPSLDFTVTFPSACD